MKLAIRYKLYTEDKNIQGIMDLLDQYFSGYTLIPGNIGVYKGQTEKSLVIDIVTDLSMEEKVRELARDIVRVNIQASVLMTKEYIESEEVLIF